MSDLEKWGRFEKAIEQLAEASWELGSDLRAITFNKIPMHPVVYLPATTRPCACDCSFCDRNETVPAEKIEAFKPSIYRSDFADTRLLEGE